MLFFINGSGDRIFKHGLYLKVISFPSSNLGQKLNMSPSLVSSWSLHINQIFVLFTGQCGERWRSSRQNAARMGGKTSNLWSKQWLVCSENITVHPILTTLKLGLCHVISIVSIFGCCVMKHHYVMAKISSVFCSQSPINPVFLSIWYRFPDSLGQNKNRSLILLR